MSEKEKKFSFKWLDKLKNIKHIEIYLTLIFIIIILLIYFGNFSSSKKTTHTENNNELSVVTYIDKLEKELTDMLVSINGVNDIKVMISLDLKELQVENSQIKINDFPDIKGVVITGKGLNNTATKLKVLQVAETLLDITKGKIQILSSD